MFKCLNQRIINKSSHHASLLISPRAHVYVRGVWECAWEDLWVRMSLRVGVEMTQALECEALSIQTRRRPVLGRFPP